MSTYTYANEPRFYYHVTQQNWGEGITLHPLPSNSECVCRGVFEPPDARICVSSHISGCYAAINFYEHFNRIYKTKHPVIAAIPFEVPDAHITSEYWLIEPTEFELVTVLDKRTMLDLRECDYCCNKGDDSEENLSEQKLSRESFKKILSKLECLRGENV